ncbi:MAG: bifunctional tRNA (5-methylaminomethyl-2-thiouridine)(34)-methyltransferase MnmD/FAD-dependent 5-carboxymethylaminomethyl-2-thiouridine(34) oxidoreductase MnmC [Pseudomonadota bacterium]
MTQTDDNDAAAGAIRAAALDWGDDARPRAADFDDIYFAPDGAAESRHVFLGGTDAHARFAAGDTTIGELGFGTGLNFLCAWRAFEDCAPAHARLTYFAVDLHPLAVADLARAHAAFPAFDAQARALRDVYPPAARGLHAASPTPRVTLLLFGGEALEGLRAFDGPADLWFLDGFAPAKNPAMWRDAVLRAVAERSAPGARAATFTVAGAVRRGLAAAGFAVDKAPGFGRKRDMLRARLETPPSPAPDAPWFRGPPPPSAPPGARIAIIGAGIAGACLADALRRDGFAPVVFDPAGPAAGASGNPAALVMPRLDLGETPAARLLRNAFVHAVFAYRRLNDDAPGAFAEIGVDRLAADAQDASRLDKAVAAGLLPPDWMAPIDGGVRFPQGGVVDPPRAVAALLGDAPVVRKRVRAVETDEAGPAVVTDTGAAHFDAVVIANGAAALDFLAARGLPLSAVAGQIDRFPAGPVPDRARAFGPYAAPAPGGGLVVGATYDAIDRRSAPLAHADATRANLAALAAGAADLAAALDPAAAVSRASVRCQTPDRLPVVGAAPDWAHYATEYDDLRFGRPRAYPPGRDAPGVYLLTGLGSRGFVTAPLCAAAITARIAGRPAPLERAVADAVHPARFFIRAMKRARPTKPQPAGGP